MFVRFVPQADLASMFIPSLPELTIGWGVAFKGKECVQCPNEPNIIVAITSTETRKGEVGVSKFVRHT